MYGAATHFPEELRTSSPPVESWCNKIPTPKRPMPQEDSEAIAKCSRNLPDNLRNSRQVSRGMRQAVREALTQDPEALYKVFQASVEL